jgi:hypothetical protein
MSAFGGGNPVSKATGIRDCRRGFSPAQWFVIGILGLMALASMTRGWRNALEDDRSDDFQWGPARQLLSGENPYRSFVESGWSEPRVTNVAGNNTPPNYPVTGYVFLAPYAALDWTMAKSAWAITNLFGAGLLVWAIWIIAKPAGQTALFWTLAACLLMLSSSPMREQVSAGQHTIFSVAALLWAWILGQKGCRWRWISMVLIAASWLKFSVTVPLTLAFLIHRRWREPLGAGMLHVGLLGLTCVWTETSPIAMGLDFLKATRLGLSHQGIHSDVWDTLAVGRALAPDFGPAGGVISLWCLAIVAWVASKRARLLPADGLGTLALLGMASCLVGFHFRYDFLVFGITLAWVLGGNHELPVKAVAGGVAALNWFGARVMEGLYYEPFDAISGYWHPAGVIGMGIIAAATWLGCSWMVTRLAVVRPNGIEAHHSPVTAGELTEAERKPEPVAWG